MNEEIKPLGQKAYGSIPHLPGSRRGIGDHGLSDGQASILTGKTRDKHDLITVQEKLDGSCVSVAKINGEIVALGRAGYPAYSSPFKMHHLFSDFVQDNKARFADLLDEGERCVGEWLIQAHGTRYALPHEPFVLFDIMRGIDRETAFRTNGRASILGFVSPKLLHEGGAFSIHQMLKVLEPSGHGALDPVEGAVWRCERKGKVDFLGKYVRPEKKDGCYLESQTNSGPIYNTYL